MIYIHKCGCNKFGDIIFLLDFCHILQFSRIMDEHTPHVIIYMD
ncbi:hypothetical protein [Azospirillum argentinense]